MRLTHTHTHTHTYTTHTHTRTHLLPENLTELCGEESEGGERGARMGGRVEGAEEGGREAADLAASTERAPGGGEAGGVEGGGMGGGYDLIILSDVIFNHVAHEALLASCNALLKRSCSAARVLVAFSHHRPRLAEQDLAFFDRAARPHLGGFAATRLFAIDMPKIDMGETHHVRTVVDPERSNVSSSVVYVYEMKRKGSV
jgi:hypothetical protein